MILRFAWSERCSAGYTMVLRYRSILCVGIRSNEAIAVEKMSCKAIYARSQLEFNFRKLEQPVSWLHTWTTDTMAKWLRQTGSVWGRTPSRRSTRRKHRDRTG